MLLQDWFRSLRSSAQLEGSDPGNTASLWPPPPWALSRSSLLGLGAVASLTAYYLVTRPRPMHPPCDLQAQSVPVKVSVAAGGRGGRGGPGASDLLRLCVCRGSPAAGARLCSQMIRCWTSTTRTPGRTTTCSSEGGASQVAEAPQSQAASSGGPHNHTFTLHVHSHVAGTVGSCTALIQLNCIYGV